jgi:hypothetical protein
MAETATLPCTSGITRNFAPHRQQATASDSVEYFRQRQWRPGQGEQAGTGCAPPFRCGCPRPHPSRWQSHRTQ